MKKIFTLATAIVFVLMGIVAVISDINTDANLRRIEVQTKQQEIDTIKEQIDAYQKKLKDAKGDQKKLDKLQKENKELQKRVEELQAKKEEEARIAAENSRNAAYAAPAPSQSISGSKEDWLKASGIPSHEWGYVDSIVTRESGWNPNAVNASSGACGLGQQLPCGKWPGAWNDPVAALKAMNGYVHDRYGGWAGAVSFWEANHWY